MTWDAEMTHAPSVAVATGTNDQGEFTYGSAAAIRARVVEDRQNIQLGGGRSVESSHRIVSHVEILETSRVWLSGADTADVNESHPVLRSTRTQALDDSESIYQAWV